MSNGIQNKLKFKTAVKGAIFFHAESYLQIVSNCFQ